MEGPSSFVFYVIARVGPQRQHYPLAVASREDNMARGFHGLAVVNACLAVGRLLGSDENRAAVEAELLLAKKFYSAEEYPVEIEGPSWPPEEWYADFIEAAKGCSQTPPRLAGSSGRQNLFKPIPFPFISTCLMLGLGYDAKSHTPHPGIVYEPLGLMLGEHLDNHGLAVLDVTDPKIVRHGIVAYEKADEPRNATDPIFDFDHGPEVEDDTAGFWPKQVEGYSRKPLDSRQYMTKFLYIPRPGLQGQIEKFRDAEARVVGAQAVWRPVAPEALNDIWPLDQTNLSRRSRGEYTEQPTEPLLDETIPNLVNGTHHAEEYPDTQLKSLEKLEIKEPLRRFIESQPKRLGQGLAAGQLLARAYGNITSLNWAAFTHTSYKAVARALGEPCMQSVRSISLEIDRFPAADLPVFLQVLVKLPLLSHLCLMQNPARMSDTMGINAFAHMAQTPEFLPLLQRVSVTISSTFSSALRGIPWLPPLKKDGASLYDAFPVSTMFLRKPVQAPELPWPERNMRSLELDREADPNPEFCTTYLPLADGLLSPERFITGFLSFLATRCEDDLLFSFAQAPTSLRHMPRQRTGLFPAENLSVPEHSQRKNVPGREKKLSQPIAAGAWIVLVSCEGPSRGSHSAPFIHYTFVQPRRPLHDITAAKGVMPDDVNICGLCGFLKATGVAFDSQVLQKRLEEVTSSVHEKIRRAQRRDRATARETWLVEMDESSARKMLGEVTSSG